MNVPNDRLLAEFRTPGNCELCGSFCSMCAAAHIFSKGAGRVDARINLVRVGLSAVADCRCHHDSHANQNQPRSKLLAVAAKREGVAIEHIEAVIPAVRACPRLNTFAAASVWLRGHFPRDVAEAAMEICKENYK